MCCVRRRSFPAASARPPCAPDAGRAKRNSRTDSPGDHPPVSAWAMKCCDAPQPSASPNECGMNPGTIIASPRRRIRSSPFTVTRSSPETVRKKKLSQIRLLRNVPRPETVPEGDAEHDRFRIENDPRGRLRRLRIKQPFELQLAFVAEFIHSVENRKKRLVFCNCFLLENSV